MTLATNEATPDQTAAPPRLHFMGEDGAGASTWGDTAFLDGLRGLAAVYVLLHHAVFLLQATPTSPASARLLAALALPLRFGHAAVIFFFVLSGFVVHLRYARRIRVEGAEATFGWRKFVVRRARRLYPPLILAILITTWCDWLGVRLGYGRLFPVDELGRYSWISWSMHRNHEWHTLVGNLAFLTQIHVLFWGTDTPLWSLAYEWWFYMLYPLLWRFSRRSVVLATGVVAALFIASRWPGGWPAIEGGARPIAGIDWLFLPRKVLTALPAWWCGALLADAYTGRIRITAAKIAPLILAPALLAIPGLGEAMRTLILGVGFVGFMAACFAIRGSGVSLRILDRLRPLGGMAYTLYVIHMPVLILVCGWEAERRPGAGAAGALASLVPAIVTPLLLAWVASLVVERPFLRAKARDERRVGVTERP